MHKHSFAGRLPLSCGPVFVHTIHDRLWISCFERSTCELNPSGVGRTPDDLINKATGCGWRLMCILYSLHIWSAQLELVVAEEKLEQRCMHHNSSAKRSVAWWIFVYYYCCLRFLCTLCPSDKHCLCLCCLQTIWKSRLAVAKRKQIRHIQAMRILNFCMGYVYVVLIVELMSGKLKW